VTILVTKKIKGKEWFSIIAPKYFGEKELGKAIAPSAETFLGKKLIVSAIDLTNDFSKYYMKLSFRVVSVDGNRVLTEFDGSECMRDYISRMVLRRVRRVDAIQDLTTKDGKKIRVKGLVVIFRRVKSSIQKTVRRKLEEITKDIVTNSTLEEFVNRMLSDEIKNEVLRELRKIYPVRNFEIRKTEVFKK
jgi:small subunit ribosomal protein S3Ae